MIPAQPLDLIPILWVFPVTVVLGLIASEVGFRLGRWWHARAPNERDPSLGALVGASLGLLAFLLAFLTGLATDRFNTRRLLVVDDANVIRTAELRARYLPEPYNDDSRKLLREYVDVRVDAVRTGSLASAIRRSEEIQSELWSKAVELVKQGNSSDIFALYADGLNHLIEVHTQRVAAVESRLAPTVLLGVYLISLLGLLLVGFNNGTEGHRSIIALVVLILMFAAVITLIVDLDRPTEGFLVISQQPMLELQQDLHQ